MTNVFDAESALDPFELFERWLAAATKTELNDPDAVALATATAEGTPSVRMVLMKGLDATGFRFFTNAESQKGHELAENPRAAMCFHWKSQRRQVRVQGSVRELSAQDEDEYFHSRGRMSQIGAIASQQSRPLRSRSELESAAQTIAERYPGVVPRPKYWRGFCLAPTKIEFWQDGADRLHDRVIFERVESGWKRKRLFP